VNTLRRAFPLSALIPPEPTWHLQDPDSQYLAAILYSLFRSQRIVPEMQVYQLIPDSFVQSALSRLLPTEFLS